MWIKKRTNELLQNVTLNSMEVTIMFWETLDDHRIELLKYQRKKMFKIVTMMMN